MNNYLAYGFRLVDNQPQCVLCSLLFAPASKAPSKFKRHLMKRHPEDVGKPLHYFQEKLEIMLLQKGKELPKKIVTNSLDNTDSFDDTASCENAKLLTASYYASLTIARNSEPYTLMETTIGPLIIVDAVREILGADAAEKIAKMPHSNTTVQRRIEDMAIDVRFQLKILLNESPLFSLQFDELADASGVAHLLCYVKYVGEGDIEERLLFCLAVSEETTGKCLFDAMMTKIAYFNLDWGTCVAICTDGGGIMTGKNVGFVERILKIAPNAKWSHSMIQRYALAVKSLRDDLNSVMEDCVSIVNYIKTSSHLESNLFEELFSELGEEYVHLLHHTKIRWLSRGNILRRLFILKDDVYIFLSNVNNPLAHMFDDQTWVCKMSYLADIVALVNEINSQIQGRNSDMINLQYKIEGFLGQIDYFIDQLRIHQVDAFPLLKAHSTIFPPEEFTINLFITHLHDMKLLIREYFPACRKYESGWVISPFNKVLVNNAHIEILLQRQLINLSANELMEAEFSTLTPSQFWVFLKENKLYKTPQLALKALRILMPFSTSYLCELGFSTITLLKNKYRNRLQNIESDLMLSINSCIQPDIKRLVNERKQANPTHSPGKELV